MRFAGSQSTAEFNPISLASGASGGNYAGAAGVVDLGNAFGAQREKAPRYDQLSAEAMGNASAERQAAMNAEAAVHGAGLQAVGNVTGMKLQADAMKDAARSQASASKFGSALGAIGKIGGALIGLSDETTKFSVTTIDSALEELRQLRPVSFYYYKEYGDPSRRHHGFIAQEFKQVLPDATYVDQETGKLCIDPIDVIGLLVRGNQELQARVSRLEAKSVLQAVK
jgi:hypothetical protein